MAWFKRISVFLAVNLLVLFTISLLLNVLGIRPYLNQYGIDYQSLALFCLVWGMGGALISLGLSKIMAKWMMGVKIVDPNTHQSELRSLVQTVHRLSKSAGLNKMPEVGVYESADINAFATGPTRSNSLVAVSSGLLARMNEREVEGVLAHEVAHIANGDMVTMTLLQGVVNAFVMFLARIIAFAIMQGMRRDSSNDRGFSPLMHFFVVQILEVVLMLFGSIVVMAYSRWREFRADDGGAKLAGRENMVAALRSLQKFYGTKLTQEQAAHPAVQSLQISGKSSGFLRFFASHPPLELRIARLESPYISQKVA